VIVQDTIAPVITLANGDEGTTNYTVERGTTYVDPGATADGGETVTVDTSELNMAVSGTYTVTYSATDLAGNTGTASRIVIVEDTTAPVIILANGDEGTTNYTVQRNSTYIDPGATADTGESVAIDTSQLNMSVSGTYTVTYSATDADDNIGTASRTVIVIGWTEQTRIQPSSAGDEFGKSISISSDGNTAIVGAIYHDDRYTNFGAAYIYTRSDTVWSQQSKLQSSDGTFNLNLGRSVCISGDGNTAIVAGIAGLVYIFIRSGTNWSEQAKIMASEVSSNDEFGESVSMSWDGNTALVGAYAKSANRGAAYIFTRSGTTWSEQAEIQGSDTSTSDRFGQSVSISWDGNTALVGADYNSALGTYAGAAYIFTRSGTTWSEQARINGSDTSASNRFGQSVSISGDGNTAIVGAWNNIATGTYAGAAYIFTRSGTTWPEQAKILSEDSGANYHKFGWSVAISGDGNNAVVGADGSQFATSAAYAFTRSGTSWSQTTKLIPSDAGTTADNQFGDSVSISGDGNTIIVGAHMADGSTGATHIFTLM
jgi:phage gpG-like protein